MLPLVSVIIPAYNSSHWIRECVDSVLGQSYPRLEIIVVDDGSRDSTLSMLRDYGDKILLLQREHVGVGTARNAGMARAHGELIAFLDSDDIWNSDKVKLQAEFMRQNPDCSMLYADAEEFDSSGTHDKSFFGNFPSLASNHDIAEAMVLGFAIPLTSTVMVRADFLRQHGLGFHSKASCAEDMSLFLEIYLTGGKISGLNQPLTRRRLHGSNTSGNHYNRFLQRLIVYDDLLQKYPDAPPRFRRLLQAGLRDAYFRVGEWHWGQLDLTTARRYFRHGTGRDRTGIRCGIFWALTFLPARIILHLKSFRHGNAR